ncbi:MAG: glycosyltransferase family 2 protein [Candidatus Kapabacteria bacterium]|nr:glycosyltransferase family 2 protein [Candidatus Kapabacteria bacterium]
MTVPFFSVIICTYQRAHLIQRALQSLVLQQELDWEAIIIDDGSTDDTEQVVQKYTDGDERFRYFRNDHVGVARSRNSGIGYAKGLFVTFLDSDDEYRADHLSSRREMLLSNTDVQLLHGGVEIIGDAMVRDRFDPEQWIHLDDCVIGGTFVVRRDLFTRVGLFSELEYGDDAEFFERVASSGTLIARTDHPSYRYYRDSPDALTRTYGTT